MPRTPMAIKKKVKKGFAQSLYDGLLIKTRSPKAFSKKSKEKEREKVLCSTHSSTHFHFILTPVRAFHSLAGRGKESLQKSSKAMYSQDNNNNKLICIIEKHA